MIFRSTTGVLCAMALGTGLAAPATAHDHGAHDARRAAVAPASGVALRLEDALLRDQDGRAVRLKSDVLGKRVAVVNFIYTTCTTVCPVSSHTMSQLQQRLGARVGAEVQLVSITVDPLRDAPARLKEYSARHGAADGWRWLTGPKSSIDAVLKAFGAYTPSPEDHPALTMIGEADGGTWTRLYGFPSAEELQAHVDRALAARVAANRP